MSRAHVLLVLASFAVVVVAALVFLAYTDDARRARAALSGGGRIVSTASGLIEYAETGVGPALLTIHGAGGGHDQGLAIASDLVGDGFRIIAPSRFGYLGTPIPANASASAQADAHEALLALLTVTKAIVVGTSAGARSAIELALRHPERVAALVLIVPATYAPASGVAIEDGPGNRLAFWLVNAGAEFAWWVTEKIAPSVLIRFIGVPPEIVATASPLQRDRVTRIVGNIQPLSARFPGINIDSKPDLRRPPLEMIRAPTLVVSARDDLFNTLPAAEFAAAAIPNAKLVVYDRGGHLLVGQESNVRTTIASFLAHAGVSSTSR